MTFRKGLEIVQVQRERGSSQCACLQKHQINMIICLKDQIIKTVIFSFRNNGEVCQCDIGTHCRGT